SHPLGVRSAHPGEIRACAECPLVSREPMIPALFVDEPQRQYLAGPGEFHAEPVARWDESEEEIAVLDELVVSLSRRGGHFEGQCALVFLPHSAGRQPPRDDLVEGDLPPSEWQTHGTPSSSIASRC